MPLMALWRSNPAAVSQFTIEQVVSTAGTGVLTDNSECAEEFRAYLTEVKTEQLAAYVEHCLARPFNRSHRALQDIVNELGRRLEYDVMSGRYQGTPNAIGYDGLWRAPEGNTLVIEVKTTDAYRISLDTLAHYRRKLLQAREIEGDSSILIVTGRDDTGELEAQIRGSRHAWDIRLISTDSLTQLVRLKENTESNETSGKIRSILVPREYTKLDKLIDVVFATAKDIEISVELSGEIAKESNEEGSSVADSFGRGFTESAELQGKRERIISALANREGVNFIKRTRALYWNSAHDVRIVCTVSKRYIKRGQPPYWYAYHPQWDEFLKETTRSYIVLGCMDREIAIAIPWKTLQDKLEKLNTTTTKDGSHYWHLKLVDGSDGSISLQLPKGSSSLVLDSFAFPI